MKDKLLKLLENSYTPISHYPVSSILETKDGKEFYGVNVEDASTRAGSCAERVAIFNAIANGVKKGEFKKISVMTSSTDEISTPCFVCRQMISELFDDDCEVVCYNKSGESKTYTVKKLCPYPFDEDDLK